MSNRVFDEAVIAKACRPNLSPVVERIERQDPESGLVIAMTRHADNTFTVVDERYEPVITP